MQESQILTQTKSLLNQKYEPHKRGRPPNCLCTVICFNLWSLLSISCTCSPLVPVTHLRSNCKSAVTRPVLFVKLCAVCEPNVKNIIVVFFSAPLCQAQLNHRPTNAVRPVLSLKSQWNLIHPPFEPVQEWETGAAADSLTEPAVDWACIDSTCVNTT